MSSTRRHHHHVYVVEPDDRVGNEPRFRKANRFVKLFGLRLRHTVVMRLRGAGVPQSTVADILWSGNASMARHDGVAQIVELHAALEKIKEDTGRWNKSLATLRREHEEAKRAALEGESHPKSPKSPPAKKNGLDAETSNPLI